METTQMGEVREAAGRRMWALGYTWKFLCISLKIQIREIIKIQIREFERLDI